MTTHRRQLARALLLALTVSLACGGSGPGDAPEPASGEAASGERVFLSIGTAPVVGGFYLMGSALAEVLNENRGPIQWQVTAEATKGSQENIRRLVAGDIELAMSNAAITYQAVRGGTGWEKPHDVAVVMTLAPNVAQFIARAGSDVHTIADLRGKRVSIGPAGAGFKQFVGPLLAAHGVSFEDFTPLDATQSAAVDMLGDGAIAAAFLGGAVPHPAVTQAAATLDLRFIPYAEEAREALARDYPFFWPVTVPAGTYRGQTEDFHGLNVGSMHLITAAGTDEELVYQVTKTLYENRAAVVERAAPGRSINPENVVRDTGTAFHPGAVRYYREAGIWPDRVEGETEEAQPGTDAD